MSSTTWKQEVLTRWAELKVDEYCEKLGIDFSANFLEPLMNCNDLESPFKDLQFSWLKNSVIEHGVLHLHPIQAPVSDVTWEEWFIHTDGLHHHVLRNYEFDLATDTWLGEDEDHPAQVCNIQWHLVNETDMRPTALR